MCVYVYTCVYYICGIYARVCASTCICAHEGQKRMLGVRLYHVLSFSLQTGYLTEHRARLMANKTQVPVSSSPDTMGLQTQTPTKLYTGAGM